MTEQFLYNKTMDQDTWFNDYKSIGEAGYRSDRIAWFSSSVSHSFYIRWRNFKTFVEENAVDETDDIVFFIQGGFPSLVVIICLCKGLLLGTTSLR